MLERELLELAAKAAGLTWDNYGIRGDGNWWDGKSYLESWNPKTDDGDALRLAVKLKLLVEYFPGFEDELSSSIYADDQLQATRLAIFKAAVRIGGGQSC